MKPWSSRADALMLCWALALLPAVPLIGCSASNPPAQPHAQPIAAPPRAAPLSPQYAASTTQPDAAIAPAATEPDAEAPVAPARPPLAEHNGCFAWSNTEHMAACVVSRSSIAHGCRDDLVMIGPTQPETHRLLEVPPQCLGGQPRKLWPADEAHIESRLQSGAYAAIGAVPSTIAPGEQMTVHGVLIEYRRVKVGTVSLVDGTWSVYKEAALTTCKGRKTGVWNYRIENPTESRIDAFAMEQGWMLLTLRTSYGIEGDIGSRLTAVVIDTSRCIYYGHGAE